MLPAQTLSRRDSRILRESIISEPRALLTGFSCMKFCLVSIAAFLFACSKDPNGAEFMVTSQEPKASCSTAVLRGLDVAVCDIPGKDKVVQFVAVFQKGKIPFQPFRVVDATEAAAAQKAQADAKAGTPDAGVAPDAATGSATK